MKLALTLIPFYSSILFAILPLPYSTTELTETSDQNVNYLVPVSRSPKSIEAYQELFRSGMRRNMELPSFEKQTQALGYTPQSTFTVPEAMRDRVNFWKKIYSEYTSKQAVIHDADYPNLIYSIVDISQFTEDRYGSYRAMARALQKYLNVEKDKIEQNLLTLDKFENSPAKIPADLFPLFRKFEKIHEKDRFRAATNRIRSQIGQREHIVKGFLFGGRYFPKMMEIFAEKGVPQELTRLPLVESAFNLSARSKVGASGIWQFMRPTGKRYLRIDRYIDERNDPIAATYAAAELLRHNYEALNSWPLAITAYNHGREGMLRASRMLASSSLPYIIQNYKAKTFGFASSNFYAEFLAILEVERDYRQHFGPIKVDAPLDFAELTLADDVRVSELVSGCKMEREEFIVFNPALTDLSLSDRVELPRGVRIRVPPENRANCLSSRRMVGRHLPENPKARRLAAVQKKIIRPPRLRNGS